MQRARAADQNCFPGNEPQPGQEHLERQRVQKEQVEECYLQEAEVIKGTAEVHTSWTGGLGAVQV